MEGSGWGCSVVYRRGKDCGGLDGGGCGRSDHGLFFFSSRRRHTRLQGDWSSDVCSSDLHPVLPIRRRSLIAAQELLCAVETRHQCIRV